MEEPPSNKISTEDIPGDNGTSAENQTGNARVSGAKTPAKASGKKAASGSTSEGNKKGKSAKK
jgi:hypothetical protein